MNDQNEEEEFFIGWEARAAAPIRAHLKKTSLMMIAAALVIAGVVTAMQQTVSSGKFDFGHVQAFSGVLVKDPVPMLVGDDGVIFYLVAPLKNGFPVEVAEEYHLKEVTLDGTLIWDELESMIEVVVASVNGTGEAGSNPLSESEGEEVVLRGEIVDSKCHLGVMNPGRFKPHRACAIQCLSGGIPPILVATSGDALGHYLMVGMNGEAIGQAVMEFAAEPVEIAGTLKLVGDRRVFYMDPSAIKRL